MLLRSNARGVTGGLCSDLPFCMVLWGVAGDPETGTVMLCIPFQGCTAEEDGERPPLSKRGPRSSETLSQAPNIGQTRRVAEAAEVMGPMGPIEGAWDQCLFTELRGSRATGPPLPPGRFSVPDFVCHPHAIRIHVETRACLGQCVRARSRRMHLSLESALHSQSTRRPLFRRAFLVAVHCSVIRSAVVTQDSRLESGHSGRHRPSVSGGGGGRGGRRAPALCFRFRLRARVCAHKLMHERRDRIGQARAKFKAGSTAPSRQQECAQGISRHARLLAPSDSCRRAFACVRQLGARAFAQPSIAGKGIHPESRPSRLDMPASRTWQHQRIDDQLAKGIKTARSVMMPQRRCALSARASAFFKVSQWGPASV